MPRSQPPSHTPSTRPHERLQAWAACHELALAVYRATLSWPHADHDILAEEARRAAVAAAVQIMIGAASGGRDFVRRLDEAGGKLARLSATLLLARDLGIVTPAACGELETLRDHAARLTGGLYRSLAKRAATAAKK